MITSAPAPTRSPACRRWWPVGCLLLAAAALAGCSSEPPQRTEPAPRVVAAEVPFPIEWVEGALVEGLRAFAAGRGDRLGEFEVSAAAPHVAAGERPGRVHLRIREPIGTLWWHDAYAHQGQPVDFQCSYELTLERVTPGQTRIRVDQVNPRVRLRLSWQLPRHGIFPARAHDIRRVEQTNADRLRVLALVLALLEDEA